MPDINIILKATATGLDVLDQAQRAMSELGTAVASAEAKRAAIRSVGDAFGVKRDPVYGEIDSLGADSAVARKLLEAKEKAEGLSRNQIKGDLAVFDKETKAAMDDYLIATGQATEASIKFRDIHASLSKAVAEGRMSLQQEASALEALGAAAKSGKTSLTDLIVVQNQIERSVNPKGVANANFKLAMLSGDEDSAAYRGAGDTKGDPFGVVRKGADDASTATAKLGTTAALAAAQLVTSGLTAAGGLQPIIATANAAQQAIAGIQGRLTGLVGSLSINVGFTESGGGRSAVRGIRGPQ